MYSGVPLTKEKPMPDNLAEVIQELRRLQAAIAGGSVATNWAELNGHYRDQWMAAELLWEHLPALLDAASRSLEGDEADDDPTKPAPGDDLRYEVNSLRETLDEKRQQNRELKKQVAENTKECERLREDYRKLSFEVRDDVAMYLCKEPEKYAEHLDLPPLKSLELLAVAWDERDAELERLRGLVRELRERYWQDMMSDDNPGKANYDAATEAMLAPLDTDTTAAAKE